jgi:hypothetical protein
VFHEQDGVPPFEIATSFPAVIAGDAELATFPAPSQALATSVAGPSGRPVVTRLKAPASS